MIWLAIAGVLNSALSLYYYARIVKYMYVDEAEEGTPTEKLKLPVSMVAAVAICVFMVILIGLWPDPFFNAAQNAAALDVDDDIPDRQHQCPRRLPITVSIRSGLAKN